MYECLFSYIMRKHTYFHISENSQNTNKGNKSNFKLNKGQKSKTLMETPVNISVTTTSN